MGVLIKDGQAIIQSGSIITGDATSACCNCPTVEPCTSGCFRFPTGNATWTYGGSTAINFVPPFTNWPRPSLFTFNTPQSWPSISIEGFSSSLLFTVTMEKQVFCVPDFPGSYDVTLQAAFTHNITPGFGENVKMSLTIGTVSSWITPSWNQVEYNSYTGTTESIISTITSMPSNNGLTAMEFYLQLDYITPSRTRSWFVRVALQFAACPVVIEP